MMFSNVSLSDFLNLSRRNIRNRYFSDSDDSDSWVSHRRNPKEPPSPIEIVVPKTYPRLFFDVLTFAGSIELQIEKLKNDKFYEFLKKLQGLKPDEHEFIYGSITRDEYTKQVEAFDEGKLDNNITIYKLNRYVGEMYNEVVKGVLFGKLVNFLTKYCAKKRIGVEIDFSINEKQANLTLNVHFLSPFFNAKRNSSYAKTLFDMLGHAVEVKPQFPVSISDAKPIMSAFSLNTTELYKFMESDGYPVSVTAPMLADLRVELREYQKQVVSWMVDRENVDMGLCDAFWEKRSLPSGGTYYFCPITSRITTRQPPRVKGGILCEEMGLGKTVEIIALLLANSPQQRHNFFQPKSSTNTTTTSTSTTTTTTSTSTTKNKGKTQTPKKATKTSKNTSKRKRKEIESPPSTPSYSDHLSPNTSSPKSTLSSSSTSMTSSNPPSPNFASSSTSITSTNKTNTQPNKKLRRSSRAKSKKAYAEDSDEDFIDNEKLGESEEDAFKEAKKRTPRKKQRTKEDLVEPEDKERQKEIDKEIQLEKQRQAEREKQKVKEKEAKEKAATENGANVLGAEDTLSAPLMKNGKPIIRSYPAEDLVHSNATLIVCPVSLLRQWITELQSKVRPGALRVLQYHGPNRDRDVIKLAKSYDVVLTAYSILTHDRSSQKWADGCEWGPLERIHWHRIVMDEAHNLKSTTSLTSKLSRILVGSIKWAVTGTPVQNSILDIIGILDFLNFDPFRAKATFNNLEPQQLVDILKALVMRHSKEQQLEGKPLVELPPRQERVVYSEFTEDERKLYNHLYSICNVKFNTLATQNSVASHYTYVMSSLILPLRQLCAHVSLVNPERFIDDTGGGAKRQRDGPQAPLLTEDVNLKPALEKLKQGDRTDITAILSKSGHPECPICLEVSDLPTITPCLHLFCNGCIREIAQGQGRGVCPLCRLPFVEGDLIDVFPKNTEESENVAVELDLETADLMAKLSLVHSSKTMKLLEELKAIRAKDKTAKAIVFTQWTPYFKKIEELLHKEGIKFAKLTGDMSMTQKGNSLTKFQSDSSITVFLLSLRSGAVGLTLTAANHLFLLDPSFNKGTEMQAINRIYRIGQTRETTITHLVAKGTIEEKIYKRNLTIHHVPERESFATTTTQAPKEKASITELMTLFA